MSTAARMFRSDAAFCAALCALVAGWLLVRYRDHAYTGPVVPPARIQLNEVLRRVASETLRRNALSGPPAAVARQGTAGIATWLNSLGMGYSENYALTGRTGQLDSARLYLEQAAVTDSTDAVILQDLGSACMAQRDYRAAAYASRRALALNPSLVPALGNLVSAFMGREMPDSAVGPMRRMLELRPNTPTYNYLLGRWHYVRGEADSAAACLEREAALAGRPAPVGTPETVQAAGIAAIRASHRMLVALAADRGDWGGARAHFDEYLRLEPSPDERAAARREWERLRHGRR